LRLTGRKRSMSLVNCEDRVQIRTEEYRVTEDEIARRFHSDFEVLVSALRSLARRRLVETENPSAYVTVNWKVCNSAIAL
jgi:hypothetical protein